MFGFGIVLQNDVIRLKFIMEEMFEITFLDMTIASWQCNLQKRECKELQVSDAVARIIRTKLKKSKINSKPASKRTGESYSPNPGTIVSL